MTFRRHPLRLEASLTRDYINQQEKMRELEQRLARGQVIKRTELVAFWVVLIGLCVWIYWNW